MDGAQIPLHPGSRARPLSNKELNGSKRLSMQLAAAYDFELQNDSDDEAPRLEGANGKSSSPSTIVETLSPESSNFDDSEGLELCLVRVKGGFNPVFFFSIAYFAAAAFFLLTVNIPELPDLLFPTIGNLLPLKLQHMNTDRVVLLIVMWGCHYVKRFGEVLFVHIYKRQVPLYEAVGSIIYYGLFGFCMGWSMNYHLGYRTPPDYLFIPGIFIYLIGEVGNFVCHLQLRYFRTSKKNRHRSIVQHPSSKHVIPYGGCFNLVSCPHYLFEIVAWLGFALSAFTLVAWLFFAAVLGNLIWYSHKKHRNYHLEFNQHMDRIHYPQNRKALIPFIY